MRIRIISITVLVILLGINMWGDSISRAQDNGYKYQWLEDNKTCEGLSLELGVKVLQISKGSVVVGYDESGVPIERRGVEIILEKELPLDKAAILDVKYNLAGLQREGGKTIQDEIAELKDEINTLKAAAKQ